MSGLHTKGENPRYLTILADGNFHEKVDEDTPDCTVRMKRNEDGTKEEVLDKDGNLVYELKYPGFTGVAQGSPKFKTGEYGTSINIDMLDDEDEKFVISISCDSAYGEKFMQLLPNLDLTQEITFKPFSFKPKNSDKKIRGMNVFQDEDCEEKILSAFEDYNPETKKSKVLVKGYPMPDPKKNYDGKWKTFFAVRREWMEEYLQENDLVVAADEPEEVAEAPAKKTNKKDGDDEAF